MKNRLTCGLGLSCLLALGLVLWSASPGVGQSQQSIPSQLAALQGQVGGLTQQIATLTQQVTGQAQHLAQLQTQVDGLGNPAVPFVARVHCNDGDTVGAALARAAFYTGPAEIVIDGICHEAVLLTRSNTILRGGAPGSGLNPGPGSDIALEVASAWNVRIYGLTLTGATVGMFITGSKVGLSSSSVLGNSRQGIVLGDGTLSVGDGSIIDSNGYVGIELSANARLWVDGSTITNNSGSGIRAWYGSSVGVNHTHITGNGGAGVEAYFNSSISVEDSVLEDNGTGVGASGMVSVFLGPGVVIRGNHGDGVHLADITAALYGGPLIQNNDGWGVSCGGPPAVALVGFASYARVTNNALGDVNCPRL